MKDSKLFFKLIDYSAEPRYIMNDQLNYKELLYKQITSNLRNTFETCQVSL